MLFYWNKEWFILIVSFLWKLLLWFWLWFEWFNIIHLSKNCFVVQVYIFVHTETVCVFKRSCLYKNVCERIAMYMLVYVSWCMFVCKCTFVHNLRHSCWWVCALDLIWMVKDRQHKHLLCGDVCSGVSNSVTRVISNAKLRYCAIICIRETSTLSCATSTSSSAQGPHQPQVNISQISPLSNTVLNLPIKPCHNQLPTMTSPETHQPTTNSEVSCETPLYMVYGILHIIINQKIYYFITPLWKN